MYCESNIEQACCVCVDIRDDFYEKTVGNAKLLSDYEMAPNVGQIIPFF